MRAAAWFRHAVCTVAGAAVGLGAAWAVTNRGLNSSDVRNGPWRTALNYGQRDTDIITRAAVARAGLLALPAKETIYWQAVTDTAGQPLDGDCTYRFSGKMLDARWWSVTVYDAKGYLVANSARVWSVNGANVAVDGQGRWAVTIAPSKPAAGAWLPGTPGQPFHLTLRMYNPGAGFRAAPTTAELPQIDRERCA